MNQREDKDDMGGHGTFERENRSLYIGRIGTYDDDVESVVRKHFGVFGKIEKIKILHAKAVAFVKYENRMSAEFAKEAMHEQSFDKGEILNVRWATEDPNPVAKEAFKIEAQTALVDRLLANPNNPSTQSFLYESQTEADLTKYYQQGDMDFNQYYYSYTYPSASGHSAALAAANENTLSKKIGFLGQSLPPPPPPRGRKSNSSIAEKRANDKRSIAELEQELEEVIRETDTPKKRTALVPYEDSDGEEEE